MVKREIAKKYIEQGRCMQCSGKLQPIDKGNKTCKKCIAKSSIFAMATVKRRKENHQCVRCGEKLKSGHPLKMCESCAVKHNKTTNAYNQKNAKYRKENNLCLMCGATNKITNIYCFDCNLKYKKYVKNRVFAKVKKKEKLLDVYFPKQKGVVLNEFE